MPEENRGPWSKKFENRWRTRMLKVETLYSLSSYDGGHGG